MDKQSYLFVSVSGDLLPRWREAFPAARGIPLHSDMAGARADAASLVWLRLDPRNPVMEQMALVRSRFGMVPIVAMSDTPGDEEALAAFSANAKGYCNSHANVELLKQVEGVVRHGGLWIGEALIYRLLGAMGQIVLPVRSPAPVLNALTEREREVAQGVSSGASNKELARQLGITERTVKAHVGAIFEKLKVRDRLQLALLLKGQLSIE